MNFVTRWTLLANIEETPKVSIERSRVISVWRTSEIYDVLKGGFTFIAEGDCRESLIEYIRDIKCVERIIDRKPILGLVVISTSKTTEAACTLMSKLLDADYSRLQVVDNFPCILINSETWNTEEILISSLIIVLESGILNSIQDWSRDSVINKLVRVFYKHAAKWEDQDLAFSSMFLAMRLSGCHIQDFNSNGPISYITSNISANCIFRLKLLVRKHLYDVEIHDLKHNLGQFVPWEEVL